MAASPSKAGLAAQGKGERVAYATPPLAMCLIPRTRSSHY